ncbi:hypothetical protein KCU65_g3801, partial [Aureobasidium melanogenum]
MDISPKITECEEYKILSSYLANPDTTDATLERLTACATSALSKTELETHLRNLWNSFLHLASQQSYSSKYFSKQQGSLVELLKSLITDASVLKDTDGKEVDFDGSKVWQGLPFFGQQVRECWNFPYHKEVDAKTRDAWINVNAFVARLTGVAINEHGGERQGYSALDYSLYGIWSLRSALEEERENSPGENTFDASIGAAAVWIVYAGEQYTSPTLKGLANSNKTYSGKVAKPGSRFKDQEWRGYNMDRWFTWRKELHQANRLVQDSNISGLVRLALKVIEI